MAALSGGDGFLCGILSNTSQAVCWDSAGLSRIPDLVPSVFQPNAYSHIAAGKDHVCAVRGSYYSDIDSGSVDCWDIVKGPNNSLTTSGQSSRFYDQNASILVFRKLVSGNGFTCGVIRDGGLTCWGPNSGSLGISTVPDNFLALASSSNSLCGICQTTGEIKCWGNSDSYYILPTGVRFVSLSAGLRHFCGIREDNHGIECWGQFNASLIPKGSGFLAIASSDFLTCGIREGDLVLDCWFTNLSSPADYDPPLQLCSPGLCTARTCNEGMFAFNASLLNEPDLTSLCVRKDLKICSPCGLNCSEGFFASSSCTSDADRVCTPCSLCQNSSCWDVCKLDSLRETRKKQNWNRLRTFLLIIGSSIFSGLLLILLACRLLSHTKKAHGPLTGSDTGPDQHPPPASVAPCPGAAQIFRLSELKDSTNGFKEFNELGRGSYGFVYRALLPDGRSVAVKRANAATIIHTNGRAFEAELEILCGLRHANIVNLLGYCSEMGERLLVYELMPHGSLHDHLHGGLSGLSWARRLRIALQAARGLEYLHTGVVPPIVHRDVRSSKILLDADWGARISDFGLLGPSEREDGIGPDVWADVYGFGVVILEILSGRKAYDAECVPPDIVEWALPRIRQGKAAAIIDRYVPLPRNVEPLLKLAEIAELALSEDLNERASMSDLVAMLEQLVRDYDGLVL
ncbi:Serine/threonine-protein kinase-like protein CCR1 [Striga hermonthica]|uniref:non-specific serine/threonine protein kinase n=1 Tax=Striga hermonthica TaxID=68872 RepID=A0A9N7NPU8_STRHE|nr:Serine/threonine-protein kinase-like protein CCR1 [Striga hermonthica]